MHAPWVYRFCMCLHVSVHTGLSPRIFFGNTSLRLQSEVKCILAIIRNCNYAISHVCIHPCVRLCLCVCVCMYAFVHVFACICTLHPNMISLSCLCNSSCSYYFTVILQSYNYIKDREPEWSNPQINCGKVPECPEIKFLCIYHLRRPHLLVQN